MEPFDPTRESVLEYQRRYLKATDTAKQNRNSAAMRDYERLSSTLRHWADRLAKSYLKYRMWRIS